MDEGVKNTELIFRATLALKEMMLKMAIAILKAVIKHMEWLKQNNIKPKYKEMIDKLQIKSTKSLSNMVEKRRDNHKELLTLKQKDMDKFKLDKQYELESYNIEIRKAQKALDVVQEGKNSLEIAAKQKLVDQALENKKEFEYKTNKELLAKNHNLDEYKKELSQCEYDLKVCNAKLNALESNRNIETGRVKKEFELVADKYLNDEEQLKMQKDDLDVEIKNENFNQKIGEDIEGYQDTCKNIEKFINKDDIQNDYESEEYYNKLDNNIDKLLGIYADTEKDIDLLNKEKNIKTNENNIEIENEEKEVEGITDTDYNNDSQSSLEGNNESKSDIQELLDTYKDNDISIDESDKEIDAAAEMLSRDENTKKIYKESREKGDFKINKDSKQMDLEIAG